MGWTKVGLQLWAHKTQFHLVLLFIVVVCVFPHEQMQTYFFPPCTFSSRWDPPLVRHLPEQGGAWSDDGKNQSWLIIFTVLPAKAKLRKEWLSQYKETPTWKEKTLNLIKEFSFRELPWCYLSGSLRARAYLPPTSSWPWSQLMSWLWSRPLSWPWSWPLSWLWSRHGDRGSPSGGSPHRLGF